MRAMASQITSLTIICSTVCLCVDQGKHQSSASLAFVRGIYRCPVNSPHKGPVTRKMLPFDDVIMHTTLPSPAGAPHRPTQVALGHGASGSTRLFGPANAELAFVRLSPWPFWTTASVQQQQQEADSFLIRSCQYRIPTMNMRRLQERLIFFIRGILMLVRRHQN